MVFQKGHKDFVTPEGRKKIGIANIGNNYGVGYKHTEEAKLKMSFTHKGEKHHNWNGGKDEKGKYVRILCPTNPQANKRGYVYEHHLVVERYLGRYLSNKEVVHHEDKNPKNNDVKNLMAFINNSVHLKFHFNPLDIKPEEIIFDGRKLNLRKIPRENT